MYQDVHYMGYHSASRSSDPRVVLCVKDLHGIQVGYCLRDQGQARQLYDELEFHDELGPHGVSCDDQGPRDELVPNDVQVIHDEQVYYDELAPQHDAQVHCDGLVQYDADLDDGQVHHDELKAHGVMEFHDAQVQKCDAPQHGELVVNVAQELVRDVPQHHGAHAHVQQHDDQQEHDAQEQKCVLDHEQFAQKLRGDQAGQSDDQSGSHHMGQVIPSDHGGYNRELSNEYRMGDDG